MCSRASVDWLRSDRKPCSRVTVCPLPVPLQKSRETDLCPWRRKKEVAEEPLDVRAHKSSGFLRQRGGTLRGSLGCVNRTSMERESGDVPAKLPVDEKTRHPVCSARGAPMRACGVVKGATRLAKKRRRPGYPTG